MFAYFDELLYNMCYMGFYLKIQQCRLKCSGFGSVENYSGAQSLWIWSSLHHILSWFWGSQTSAAAVQWVYKDLLLEAGGWKGPLCQPDYIGLKSLNWLVKELSCSSLECCPVANETIKDVFLFSFGIMRTSKELTCFSTALAPTTRIAPPHSPKVALFLLLSGLWVECYL